MITTSEIKHLASLARIELLSEEAERMTGEIDSILGYVGQVNAIEVTTTKEVPHLRNVMREDIPTNKPSEYTEDLLTNATAREGNYFKVKKIL